MQLKRASYRVKEVHNFEKPSLINRKTRFKFSRNNQLVARSAIHDLRKYSSWSKRACLRKIYLCLTNVYVINSNTQHSRNRQKKLSMSTLSSATEWNLIQIDTLANIIDQLFSKEIAANLLSAESNNNLLFLQQKKTR